MGQRQPRCFCRNHFLLTECVNADSALCNREVGARKLGPAAAVKVVHVLGRIGQRVVGVSTANCRATFSPSVFHGPFLDFLGTAQECLARFLGELGKVMRSIQLLQAVINEVTNPRKDRMSIEKLIEHMTVQDQDALPAAQEDILILDRHAEEMRDNFCGSIMIPAKPDDLGSLRELADER